MKSRMIRTKRRIRVGLLGKRYARFNNFLYHMYRQSLLQLRWIFNSLDYYSKVYEVIKQDPHPPNIIHANDLDTLAIACLISFRTKTKLVYDAQELYTGLHTLPQWYRVLLSIQEFILIRFAHKITAVNDFIAEEMEWRYKVEVDKVILNCPPYEANFSKRKGRTIRKKFSIGEETPIYLYSGGLVKQRGIESTILALKYLKKGVLVILGEGQLKKELIQLIKRKHLEDRVLFSNFVPHTEVPRFISSADVGILPYENVGINHYLCSPSKLFHYIMAELPVACSDFPFLRKVVVGNGLGATFDPTNPRSIANAIAFICKSGKYLEIKSHLKTAKKKYCWKNEELKFMHVYESLTD
jgi:glycosyltransferase involved in cell wall biosynthesis